MILLLLACLTPGSFEECSQLGDSVARSDCQFGFAKEAEDPQPLLDVLSSDLERDVLIVRLAEEDPRQAGRLCQQARTTSGRKKCDSVLGRPHLGAWKGE